MMPTSSKHDPMPTRARGVTYPIVLAITVMLTIIGMTSVYLSRVSVVITRGADDWTTAQRLAASGLHHALIEVEAAIATAEATSSDWRAAYTHGTIMRSLPLDDGKFSWKLEDASDDGDLRDDPVDPVYVIATGEAGASKHTLRVRLDPVVIDSSVGIDCLAVGLQVGGGITLNDVSVMCDQTIASNTSVTASSASVDAAVESVGSISGGTYLGTTTTGVTARRMPDASVFDSYLEHGTPINITDLEFVNGKRVLTRTVLSPTNNPYGDENPEGIYVIDCSGMELKIEDARIVGTLVILDPGPGTRLGHAINWEPALANYPALLVDGDLDAHWKAQDPLDETDLGGKIINFNPPSTPWQGQTDGTQASDSVQRDMAHNGENFDAAVHDDVYPSLISGLVYVSGNLTLGNNDQIKTEGVIIVGGTVSGGDANTTLDITYRDTFLLDPPPGFGLPGNGPLRVTTGSVEQIVQP